MIIKDKKAPGQKLIDNLPLKTKWLICLTGGLSLISSGLLFFGQAIYLRMTPVHTSTWMAIGLLGLILVNIGLVLFSRGGNYRAEIRSKKIFKERQKLFRKEQARKKKAARGGQTSGDLKIQKNS